MRATLAKVLVLTLALALALSGCNLIQIDYKMRADREIAGIQENYSTPVATYDGGEITAAEAMSDFNNSYSQTYYMYYYYFGSLPDHETVHQIIESTLQQHVRLEVVAAHYDAEHSLSDAELAEIEETAQADYELNLEAAADGAEGESEEERNENARVQLYTAGMDFESAYRNGVINAKYSAMEELLRDEVPELTDEELQAAYDAKVAEQQESFTDGRSFETAMSNDSEIVCWQPDGYRTVKHILLIPSDETMSAYTSAVSERDSAQSTLDALNAELEAANDDTAEEGERSAEEIQADIDAAEETLATSETAVTAAAQACLDEVKPTTDEIYDRLEAGESFEDLMAEYGEDPGMQSEPTMTSGYYVSTESESWQTSFRDAAMALAQVGDYTAEPVVSGSGVHIIQYTSDVLGGEVPLEDVHDALYDEALEEAKQAHVTETMDGWVAEVNPSYDVDRFEAIFAGEE